MSATFMPIFKRLAGLSAVVMLAACSGGNDNGASTSEADQSRREAEAAGKIECALAGGTSFTRVCTTERIAGPEGQILVIRHPDGGFRRFNILTDGRGLAPAQGADDTRITILNDGRIELQSADDRYRLPAKVKANASEAPAAESGAAEEKGAPGANGG